MSDTPRMDAILVEDIACILEHVRQLERELAAWREHGKAMGFEAGQVAGEWCVLPRDESE